MAKYLSSVSRNLPAEDRSWESVVHQAGLALLDSELNLAQDIANKPTGHRLPSGVKAHYPQRDNQDFVFYAPTDPSFVENAVIIRSFYAEIAGKEVFVGGANSTDAALNKVILPAPSASQGAPPDIKRTDFVFLEMWRALVTPSNPARGQVRVLANFLAGEAFTIDATDPSLGGNSVTLTEGVDFNLGASTAETARNISTAINGGIGLGSPISAETRGTDIIFLTFDSGAAGNNIQLSSASAGLTLTQAVNGTDGEGKPNPASVWYQGNTQSDASLWLADDIQDPNVGSDTSRRIQVQYRFRVYSDDFDGGLLTNGVDPKTQFYGFENANVYAQGGAGAPDANYPFSRANGVPDGNNSYPIVDNGLFYSGDGSQAAATALNTVDGYVYAIPIAYAFRRNEGIFDPLNGVNNGLLTSHAGTNNAALSGNEVTAIPATLSDRPDGLFSDQIAAADILDLRRKVYPAGMDFTSELDNQFKLLLDNRMGTWQTDGSDLLTIGSGSGDQSIIPLVCDEIGRSGALGGNGSTGRGNFIRNFDHVCTRFSDRPTVQRLTLILDVVDYNPLDSTSHEGGVTVVSSGGGQHNTNSWFEGDEITVDLTQLDISTSVNNWTVSTAGAPIGLSSAFPTGTKVVDIIGARHNAGEAAADIDQTLQFSDIQGLGTNSVTLILDRNRTVYAGNPIVGDTINGDVAQQHELILTLVLEYPAATGLSLSPTDELEPDSTVYPYGTLSEVDINDRPSELLHQLAPNPNRQTKPLSFFRRGSREVALEMITKEEILIWSDNKEQVTIPFKIHYDGTADYEPEVFVGGNPVAIDFANSVLGETKTVLKFQVAFGAGQRDTQVLYFRRAPVSNTGNGYQVGVYYRIAGPQTCGTKAGVITTSVPSTISLKPISVSERIFVLQGGAGSPSESYPYPSPTDQLGTDPNLTFTGEDSLAGSANVVMRDFSAETGLLSLPALVPLDSTQVMTLSNPVKDVESRAVYTQVSTDYLPATFTTPLAAEVVHKNAAAMLARVEADTSLYRKGEVVLVVFVGTSGLTGDNQITMTTGDNSSIASVYRAQNLAILGE